MFQAFVGIINLQGLTCLFSEGSVPLDWLARRASLRPAEEAFCFRAVVSKDAAAEVREELAQRRPALALDILHGRAIEIVPLESSNPAVPTFPRCD